MLYDGEGTNIACSKQLQLRINVHNFVHVFFCVFTGHSNVRETIQRQLARDTPIIFRKKRAPSTSEKRTPPSRATFSGSDIHRGKKRRASDLVLPSREVLQLHNYFSKVD